MIKRWIFQLNSQIIEYKTTENMVLHTNRRYILYIPLLHSFLLPSFQHWQDIRKWLSINLTLLSSSGLSAPKLPRQDILRNFLRKIKVTDCHGLWWETSPGYGWWQLRDLTDQKAVLFAISFPVQFDGLVQFDLVISVDIALMYLLYSFTISEQRTSVWTLHVRKTLIGCLT